MAGSGRAGRLFAALALAAGIAQAGPALAQKTTLVIGMDIGDTVTFDPARQAQYSPPLTLGATYDRLVTMAPGDYATVRPQLAESWRLSDDGQAWIFELREGARFASGNPVTAADVKWSLDRLQNLKDQPAQYAENLAATEVLGPRTVKLTMVDRNQPLLTLLVAVPFAIYDSKLLMQHGGDASPQADQKDTATSWLDQNSAGAGPYRLVHFERNSEIVLERNEHYWRGIPPFQRVVIRHAADSGTQLLMLRRGDIDVAMNLTAEHLASIAGDPGIAIEETVSLDYMYMTLTGSPELNPALAHKACRQAVAHAIDYDGLIRDLLQGFATRPATFIPIGLAGSSEAIARELGYREDLDRARALLAECGHPDGFSFELNYARAAIAGTSYDIVAQKIERDLARVGIRAELSPLSPVALIDRYRGAKTTSSVLTFWNPDAPEAYLWSQASVFRVADRVHWQVPESLRKIVFEAAGEHDRARQEALYRQYTLALVDQAHYIILLQPYYRIATRKAIEGYVPTAAGWLVDLFDVRPAG